MTSLATAVTAFNGGDLDAAIAAATAASKQAPGDPAPRLLLAELLLFDAAFDRIETLLGALAGLSPEHALPIAEFRQLLRAEQLRREVFDNGAVPSFIGEPTPVQQEALRALVALRAGETDAAAEACARQEAARPRVSGKGAERHFEDFRDADDILSGSFELLTTTGSYYWVPTERVVSLQPHPLRRPRDLFWRRCTMLVKDGPEGDVYLPVTYLAGAQDPVSLRLGRETAWTDTPPVRGRGQRLFVAGDEALTLDEASAIEFGPA